MNLVTRTIVKERNGHLSLLLFIENVSKALGGKPIIKGVTLGISKGEVYCLLGPNGAGKTTLLKMISTLMTPDDGNIYLDGCDIIKHPSLSRQKMGVVRQFSGTDALLKVWEVLDFYAKIYRIPSNIRRKRIQEVLESVELKAKAELPVTVLSGGEAKRLSLARAFLHTPLLLLLDEPTTGLDPYGKKKIWSYIENLNKQKKVTIFMTTHDMTEADYLADRVGIMDFGEIVIEGSPDLLKRRVPTKAVIECEGNFSESVSELIKGVREVKEAHPINA